MAWTALTASTIQSQSSCAHLSRCDPASHAIRWREHLTTATLRSYLGPGRCYYHLKPAGSPTALEGGGSGGGGKQGDSRAAGVAAAVAAAAGGIDNPDQR